MSELKPFEIEVGGVRRYLMLGECAVFLFRQNAEVDYFSFYDEDDEPVRVYKNQMMSRWMAGYELTVKGHGLISRVPVTMNGQTFREMFGWNPAVIEKEKPHDWEEQEYAEVQMEGLDEEWSGFNE